MSLRDDIAARLMALLHEAQVDANRALEEMRPRKFPVEVGEILANEVIRLMEWSRRKCAIVVDESHRYEHLTGHGYEMAGDIYVTEPRLTLPPDDWKP